MRKGLPLATLDAVCQTVNVGRAVDVPTTVGFCMYIRRKALDEVGAFDAERFGQATALFTEVALADNYADFLTIPAYERMP